MVSLFGFNFYDLIAILKILTYMADPLRICCSICVCIQKKMRNFMYLYSVVFWFVKLLTGNCSSISSHNYFFCQMMWWLLLLLRFLYNFIVISIMKNFWDKLEKKERKYEKLLNKFKKSWRRTNSESKFMFKYNENITTTARIEREQKNVTFASSNCTPVLYRSN